MRQAFPMEGLNALAGLFDGSNRARGQMEAAKADYAAQQARELRIQNDARSPENMYKYAGLSAGLDENQSGLYGNFMRGLSFESTRPPEAEGDQPANLPQVAPDMSFLTPEIKSKLGRELQNRIGVMSGGGNVQQQMSARLAAEEHDKTSRDAMIAYNLFQKDPMLANQYISSTQGKTFTPYDTDSNGLVVNKSTGMTDASSPIAQARVNETNSQAGLNFAKAETEAFDQRLKTAQTEKQRADILASRGLDATSYKIYQVPVLGQDGTQAIGVDGKPMFEVDAGGLSADTLFAQQNGVPLLTAYAARTQNNSANTVSKLGGLVEKLTSLGKPVDRRNDPQAASVGTMLDSRSKAAALIQSGQVRTPDDVRRLLQTGQIDALGARYIADYMSGKK